MSRDIMYIGMDVHKEAVVIAVLSSSGKLVMESIVETKATSILQFIHRMRQQVADRFIEGLAIKRAEILATCSRCSSRGSQQSGLSVVTRFNAN
jgi:hypothetical protein